MSKAMEKRLEALEARKAPWTPPPDISGWIDATMAMCEAREAGRPYSHWPRSDDVEPAPEPMSEDRRRTLASLETIAKRLREQPDFAEWEADRERRLAANLRAIEREQAEREVLEAA